MSIDDEKIINMPDGIPDSGSRNDMFFLKKRKPHLFIYFNA